MRPNRDRGNVLILVVVIFLAIVLAIGLFSLSYTRLVGSHQEHKTAIESAALAAANDLSRIVIEDPNFGFIGLSDAPPTLPGTIAGDRFYTSVQSINTLMARIRLDMIIADKLRNLTMGMLLAREYQQARQALARLSTKLNEAVLPGGSARAADGTIIRPYNDAQQAYLANCVRLNGGKSDLKQGSLKITLGLATGLCTNTPIPTPTTIASLSKDLMQENNCYLPFVDIPYNGFDFVFSAGADSQELVDVKTFYTGTKGLPYALGDIVKCEADQITDYKNQYAQTNVATLHIAACAQPACVRDPIPNESALALRFSSGTFANIARPGDILFNARIQNAPADVVASPSTGDVPPNSMLPTILVDATTTHPSFGVVANLAVYDWIRNQGLKIDVGSLINFLNKPFDKSIAANIPQVHYFRADTGGNIVETVTADDPTLALPVSQNQYYAMSGGVICNDDTAPNPIWYDLFVRDFVYKLGRIKGGLHAGEPFGTGGAIIPANVPKTPPPLDEGATQYATFPTGPAGGGVRPTYGKMGTAVEIRFKTR